MFAFLRNYFRRPVKAPVIALDDPDFGRITFFADSNDETVGIWQMEGSWTLPAAFAEVGCSSIPGTLRGPAPESRSFLLAKRDCLLDIWRQSKSELEMARQKWRPGCLGELHEVFVLSGLALDEFNPDAPCWEATFEAREGRALWLHIQFRGETIAGSSIDT